MRLKVTSTGTSKGNRFFWQTRLNASSFKLYYSSFDSNVSLFANFLVPAGYHFQPFVLQILLVGARYQTHLVYSCGVAKQTSHILNGCLYQAFLGVLLLYIALAMRQSSGWACSANDKKKKLFDLVRHFPALLFQSLFFLVGRLFSCPANSAYTRIRRPSVGRWQSQQMSVTAQQKEVRPSRVYSTATWKHH